MLVGPLRVCYVVNAVDQTVAEVDIAVALQNNTDVEVDVLAWFTADDFYGDDAVTVIDLEAPDTKTGIDRRTLQEVTELFDEYDLVQANHNHSGSIAKVIARAKGIPVVSREGNTRDGFTRLGRVANGLTNPLADRVVCNSEAVFRSFTRWERALLRDDRVEFIPNGVDPEQMDREQSTEWSVFDRTAVDPESVLIGSAGTLDRQKNHETLIRAVADAKQGDRQIELVIAGDGPRRAELASLVDSLGMEDDIHFLGYVERPIVYKLLSEIDIYAMPSRWEGFSVAALEALGSGLPCIFSSIPPFQLPYSDVALFHPVADSERLSEHIVRLYENEELRTTLGQKGLELIERKYTVTRVAEQYHDLYQTVVSASE